MYVVIEGVDGAGKTTVAQAVCESLRKELPDRTVIQMREPPDTFLGHTARSYFIEGGEQGSVDPHVAALLMAAARVDGQRGVGWSDGKIRVSDRSFVTTYTHQREVPTVVLDHLHGFTPKGPLRVKIPDLLLYLRVSPETAIRRVSSRGLEHLPDAEISELCRAYDEVVARFAMGPSPGAPSGVSLSIATIDAERPLEEVVADCLSNIWWRLS